MILVIDNYDSFTYNLVDLIARHYSEVTVVKNDQVNICSLGLHTPSAIIISPGPGSPKEYSFCWQVLGKFHQKLPILGICLGHQLIGAYWQLKLTRSKNPTHGKLSRIFHNDTSIFSGLPQGFKVMRYHSLVLDSSYISNDLNITAKTEDGEVMALAHKKWNVVGVQFHPESILSEYGNEMIVNWFATWK